ncbi:MAG: sodium/proton-translocating pyrophosphatase [Phycisphaerae bacterium]|nr:sodium/proton-translocating pyrophosphatase [Phycisphaerae bacterium]
MTIEPSSLSLASVADLPTLFWLAPVGAVAALILARGFTASVLRRSEGDPEMVRIAAAVREGAMAYLKRQYRVVAIVFICIIAFLGLSSWLGLQPALSMLGVPIAGFLSGLCGWFGMRMATNASARTTFAAKTSLNEGLTVAFRSGAVMGLNVVGFALLDASIWFVILNTTLASSLGLNGDIRELTTIMLSFAMGASTQALFARVGGGIYTKAADVGADLVGKVEAGIPEDDARNPATIADNVGDNVGDVAGMGADLYESYYGSILATMALGAAAAFTLPDLASGEAAQLAMLLVAAPLILAGVGIFCSIAGIFTIRAGEDATFSQLLKILQRGVLFSSILIFIASFALLFFLLGKHPFVQSGEVFKWWGLGVSIGAGLFAGVIIARATEYFTSYENAPTRGIAIQGQTGPATVIISGIATGMRSTWVPLLTVVVAVIAAFVFAGGKHNFLMGLYGVSIAAVGMLATLGLTLATDAYGPIADNAGGNAEMSGQPPFVRERTDKLDSLGNTTAATGKGFAIGSAALTALALFAAYVQVVQTQQTSQGAAFARTFDYAAAKYVGEATRERPHAIYEGYGKFAIVFPRPDSEPAYDGGMIDRSRLQEHILDSLAPGMVLPVAGAPTDRLLRVTAEISHGDHTHEYEQEIVAARNSTVQDVLAFYDVTLTNPAVLGGLFMGVLLAFLFCAMTMSAVGRAAYAMMGECRRQFAKMREGLRAMGMSASDISNPENWPKQITHEGKQYPDYATCVSISTAGAQREMIVPAVLAIAVPIIVGLTLGVAGVMGMLAGGLSSGFAVAVFMANAGGAWDNAKKLIESYGRITADAYLKDPAVRDALPLEIREGLLAKAEELQRQGRGAAYVYGKGSDDHKATVVGDTVGDPFKDTSGPALNILIKLISIVSVVFAGLIVKFGPIVGEWIGLN